MNNDAPPELESNLPEAWGQHRPVPPAPRAEQKRPDTWNTWHGLAALVFIFSVLAALSAGAVYFGSGLALCIGLVIIGELNEIKRRP